MEFLLGCSTRYLTSESDIELNTGREILYQKENMYHFLSYKHHSPKPTRKLDKRPWIENGERFAIHSSTRQCGTQGD